MGAGENRNTLRHRGSLVAEIINLETWIPFFNGMTTVA